MNKKDLLKLIVDLQERISKLEANKSIIQPYRTYIPYIKTDQCSLGGDCRYPDPWFATIPPHCTRCGLQAQSLMATYTDNSKSSCILGNSCPRVAGGINRPITCCPEPEFKLCCGKQNPCCSE